MKLDAETQLALDRAEADIRRACEGGEDCPGADRIIAAILGPNAAQIERSIRAMDRQEYLSQDFSSCQDSREETVRDYAGGRPRQPRRSASHMSPFEQYMAVLLAALILGLLFAHAGDGAHKQAQEWRAEDARMQAELNRP